MGDMAESGRMLNEMRKDRHRDWKISNMTDIEKSGIQYRKTNDGECLLFREAGKPKVDFYPSTGRWRVAGQQKTFSGGAKSFLNWYSKL